MPNQRYADGRAGIDAPLVERLIAAQFPQWRHLPVRPVQTDGWDNRTYRLGDELSVRLPTAAGYAPAVDKEDRWLPILGPQLPVPVPLPVAKGSPAEGYPFNWSVRRWLDGEPATANTVTDMSALAVDVATFIRALQRVDATDGPFAGAHSFFRGASLEHYDAETRVALDVLAGRIDTDTAEVVWNTALGSVWDGAPVWFHGDIASGNLLVTDGRLTAVIDFGTSGVGDPSCDLVIAWTMFGGDSLTAFRAEMNQAGIDQVGVNPAGLNYDVAMWARGRGWALWKALICLARDIDTDPDAAAVNQRVIDNVLADHLRSDD